ncbi:MAG: hypothetical protein ACFBZ8_02770 [Opitutales bacterium]
MLAHNTPARSRPGASTAAIVIVLGVALLGVIAGGVFFLNDDEFSDLEPLPAANVLESPERLIGNTYLLRARINEQLPGYKEGVGRLVSVQPLEDDAEVAPFSVFVPDQIEVNIEVEQRYRMEVYMDEDFLLRVNRMEKY